MTSVSQSAVSTWVNERALNVKLNIERGMHSTSMCNAANIFLIIPIGDEFVDMTLWMHFFANLNFTFDVLKYLVTLLGQ